MTNMNRPIFDFLAERLELLQSSDAAMDVLVTNPPVQARDKRRIGSGAAIIVSDGTADGAPSSCCPVLETAEPANFSSAVLIAPRLVLTAGHSAPGACFIRIPAAHYLDGPKVEVSAVHRGAGFDLALLILKDPVAVAPARLATQSDFETAKSSGIVFCGFGYTRDAFGHLSAPGIKRISKSAVPVIATPLPAESKFDPAIEFIAGGQTQSGIHDAESGDSGGPGYLAGGDNDIVVGIDSRNALGHRSILTRVDAHLGWISLVASKEGIPFP